MGEKRLYTDNMNYTEEADQIQEEIKEKIVPIISSYIEAGYSEPEVMYILQDTIGFELMLKRMHQMNSKQQESEEN